MTNTENAKKRTRTPKKVFPEDFIRVSTKNLEKVYLDGNEIVSLLTNLSVKQVIRNKQAGKFGIRVIDSTYPLKDVLEFNKPRLVPGNAKQDSTKLLDFLKAQKMKIEVHRSKGDIVPVGFAGYVCANLLSMYHRSINDTFVADDFLDDESKQYVLDKLESIGRSYLKQESEINREIISKYEADNE